MYIYIHINDYLYVYISTHIWILHLIQGVDFMFQICKVKHPQWIPTDARNLRLGSYGLAVLRGFPRLGEGEEGIYH